MSGTIVFKDSVTKTSEIERWTEFVTIPLPEEEVRLESGRFRVTKRVIAHCFVYCYVELITK